MFTKDYINVCIELALEYMKLGKTKRATALFNHTLTAVKSGKASEDVCVMFYLRHAESLALAEDISKRYNQRSSHGVFSNRLESSDRYSEALVRARRLGEETKGMSTLERVQCRVGRLEKAAIACHVFALIQHSRV